MLEWLDETGRVVEVQEDWNFAELDQDYVLSPSKPLILDLPNG